jgi:hypothetical protein
MIKEKIIAELEKLKYKFNAEDQSMWNGQNKWSLLHPNYCREYLHGNFVLRNIIQYIHELDIECDCKSPVERLEQMENNLYEAQRNMTTTNLEKCDACNVEFNHGETYSVMNFHELCRPKKEPKVYAAHNALDVNIGQYYEGLVCNNKWIKIKIDRSPVVSHSPEEGVVQLYATFYSGNKKFSVIRECEQPEEKVRVVTIEEIASKIKEGLFSPEKKLMDNIVDMLFKHNPEKLEHLFGEKVVVEN